MSFNHKETVKKFKNSCYTCGIKNYSVVTMSNDAKWSIHPEFLAGSPNYESSRDAANGFNEIEGGNVWAVIVLKCFQTPDGIVPLCVICSGKPLPKLKKRDETPKENQQKLFT